VWFDVGVVSVMVVFGLVSCVGWFESWRCGVCVFVLLCCMWWHAVVLRRVLCYVVLFVYVLCCVMMLYCVLFGRGVLGMMLVYVCECESCRMCMRVCDGVRVVDCVIYCCIVF